MPERRDGPVAPMPDTGEEAYLRRLAMSQRHMQPVQPPSAPSFIPQASPDGPDFTPAMPQSPPARTTTPPRFIPAAPPLQEADAMLVEPSPPGQPETSVQSASMSLTQAMIDERKKAAAAVAAKLAALSKPTPPAPELAAASQPDAQVNSPARPP